MRSTATRRRRTGRTLLAAMGAALACAAPASAAGTSPCVVDHPLVTPLTGFGDARTYALAPGGDLESGARGWTLAGGAAVVLGNEPWYVGGTRHRSALRLPSGASATTAPMCIDETYPLFRMFVRNATGAAGALKVEVLLRDPTGRLLTTGAGALTVSTTSWTLSRDLRIALAHLTTTVGGSAPVLFRFTAVGGDWLVDDVYVDPFARR